MSEKPILSVIVPVYRGIDLFKRCLDSLVKQESSYPYEIVLSINLDADPKCIELANDIVSKDPRFISITMTETNLAKMLCRLEGVKVSSGSYITFMDNDDYYDNCHAINDIINEVKKNESDITIFPFFTSRKNKVKLGIAQGFKAKTLSNNEAIRLLNRDISMPHFLWNKVFKKELFDKELIIFDKKDDMFEDCAIVSALFLNAETFYRSDIAHYCYVIDNPNSETKIKRTDRAAQHLKEYEAERNYINAHHPQYIKYWRRAKFRQWTFIFFDSLCDLKNGRSNFFRLWKELNKLHRN